MGIGVGAGAIIPQDNSAQPGRCIDKLHLGAVNRLAGDGVKYQAERIDQGCCCGDIATVVSVDIAHFTAAVGCHGEAAVVKAGSCRVCPDVADESPAIGGSFGQSESLAVAGQRVGNGCNDRLCHGRIKILIAVSDFHEQCLAGVEQV